MKQELFDLGEHVIRDAEKLGAQQVEAYLTSRKQIQIRVEQGTIKTAEEKHDVGCAIRTVIGKKLGFAFTSTINRSDIQASTKEAVSLAKFSLPDNEFHSFPTYSGSFRTLDGIYDPKTTQITSEAAVELLLRGIDACKTKLGKEKALIEGELDIQVTELAIINSLDTSGSYRDTLIELSVDPTIKSANSQASSFEFQISRTLTEIDPEWIGRIAATNTQNSLYPKTIKDAQLPVIFTPMALDFLFRVGLAAAFNAEEIQMGRSYLAESIDCQIAPSYFHLSDNALLPKGNRSRPFDAEGYPSQNTEIIVDGELNHFLHNSYTAHKAQLANTGNADRSSYQEFPRIAPSNLVITPGKGTLDDLIAEMGRGILCRFTFDKPNLSTGDLSALVMEGYYIDKGEIQYPVKNTLIGINMRDFFQGITLIGADTRSLHTVVSPSLVIESAKITSG